MRKSGRREEEEANDARMSSLIKIPTKKMTVRDVVTSLIRNWAGFRGWGHLAYCQ